MEDFTLDMKKCECCESHLINLFSLGRSPYGDAFQPTVDKAKSLTRHPLDVNQCISCGSLTLKDSYSASEINEAFVYESNITAGLNDSFAMVLQHLTNEFHIESVLDIGSNDGTYLQIAMDMGIKNVIGVEPAEAPLKSCLGKGISAHQGFFDAKMTNSLKSRYGQFDLISLNYVFANMRNLQDVLNNCKEVLNENGKVSIITGYHPKQFKEGMVDYIYHEHLHYFTITGLCLLAEKCGFQIREVMEVEAKGGSICVILETGRGKLLEHSDVVNIYRIKEKTDGWLESARLLECVKRYREEISNLKEILLGYKNKGYTIVGFGASLSTGILCTINDFGDVLDIIVDDNVRKHGLFSPQYGKEVRGIDSLDPSKSHVVAILAWQHMTTIYERHKGYSSQIRWLAPFVGEL